MGEVAKGFEGSERMNKKSIRDLARNFRHPRPDARQEDPRATELRGTRAERGGHERVLVELAAEIEALASLPAAPDLLDREHHLAHARGGL